MRFRRDKGQGEATPESAVAQPVSDEGQGYQQAPDPAVAVPAVHPYPEPPDKRKAKDAVPDVNEITSVGVAIMPGVPLPDWVTRESLTEFLIGPPDQPVIPVEQQPAPMQWEPAEPVPVAAPAAVGAGAVASSAAWPDTPAPPPQMPPPNTPASPASGWPPASPQPQAPAAASTPPVRVAPAPPAAAPTPPAAAPTPPAPAAAPAPLPVATAPAVPTPLPPPNPADRSEHPMGPVVWGPVDGAPLRPTVAPVPAGQANGGLAVPTQQGTPWQEQYGETQSPMASQAPAMAMATAAGGVATSSAGPETPASAPPDVTAPQPWFLPADDRPSLPPRPQPTPLGAPPTGSAHPAPPPPPMQMPKVDPIGAPPTGPAFDGPPPEPEVGPPPTGMRPDAPAPEVAAPVAIQPPPVTVAPAAATEPAATSWLTPQPVAQPLAAPAYQPSPQAAPVEPQPFPATAAPAGVAPVEAAPAGAPAAAPAGGAPGLPPVLAEPGVEEAYGTGEATEGEPKRSRRGLKWILIVGIILIVVAAAAYAAFVTPGLLNSSAPPPPPATIATPPTVAGLTKEAKVAEPAGGNLKKWATASGASAGSQYATYGTEATSSTVWLAPKGAADLTQAFAGYPKIAGIKLGAAQVYPAGARGGSYQCAAVDSSQSVCFWTTQGIRGGADVSGLTRTEAAQLVAKMRVGLEPVAPAS